MDDIIPRQPRDIQKQRSQFRSSYYYAPTRPTYGTPPQTQYPLPQAVTQPPQPVAPPRPAPQLQKPTPAPRSLEALLPPAPPILEPVVQRAQPQTAAHANDLHTTYAPEPIEPTQTQRRFAFAPVFVAIAIILGSVGLAGKLFFSDDKPLQKAASKVASATDEPSQINTNQEQIAKTTTPPPVLTTAEEMDAAINSVIAANRGINTAVAVIDIKNNKTTTYGVDAPFDAASTGKVVSAVDYLKQVEAGSQTLDKTLGSAKASTQIKSMIEQSSNEAWVAINKELGKSQLQDFGRSVGMASYSSDKNQMKPKDLATLLQQVYEGKILNDTNKNLLLEHMKNANKTDFILKALPTEDVKTYHKAGWLSDRSHDAAIVDNGTNPYIIVVFTKGVNGEDEAKRINILHQVTNATVAHFISKDIAARLAQ